MSSNKGSSNYGLTARELEVLKLLAEGKGDKAIAAILVVSVRTVQTHVSHIFDKLGVSNRTEAARWYWQHKDELES